MQNWQSPSTLYHKFFVLSIFLIFLFGKNVVSQTPSDSIAQLDLLFVGDVMGHAPQIRSAEIKKDESYDYTPCFQYLKPIIDKADLAIANLEVTLPGKPPYQGYPMFRSPDELAYALRQASFDVLVTSNNHSNDAGRLGVENTIKTVRENGFHQTGTFLTMEERELYYPLIVYKNDFKIAFLNYTYGTNSHRTVPPTFVNRIDTALIRKDMEEAKLLKPDAIIAIIHWGKEYKLIESKAQNKLSEQIFSWGADLIIGMHPHVVQPIREYEIPQPDGSIKKTLVTYSLGNFISNQKKLNTDGGLMFEISLLKNKKTGKVTLGEHHYIPVWRYIHRDKKKKPTYYAIPISAFENGNEHLIDMNENAKTAMQAFAKTTREHLQQFSSSERKISIEELGEIKKLESKKVTTIK